MPFKLGAAPIRRTFKYLEAGRLVFKDRVKIMTVNFNMDEEKLIAEESVYTHQLTWKFNPKKEWWIKAGPEHEGAQDFVFWNLPRIQYKNPNVQMVTFKNLTPTPFITCFMEDGKCIKIMTIIE